MPGLSVRLKYFGLGLFVAFLPVLLAAGFALYYLDRIPMPAPATAASLAAPPGGEAPLARYPFVPDGPVRNVILFIGDGMGHSQVAAARIHRHGADGRLAMERMPVTGLVNTHSFDHLITDSGASATAFATGVKTHNQMIGLAPDSSALTSILHIARAAGLTTGVVTTTFLADATPAAFVARVPNRYMHDEIASQMAVSGTDMLIGAEGGHFLPRHRSDGRDLAAEARRRGYRVVHTLEEATTLPVLALFDERQMRGHRPAIPLAALTARALDLAATRDAGFFLMIEQEHADTDGHDNDFSGVVDALLQLDDAVALALDFALRDGQTLVLVTADHETGGLGITGGERIRNRMDARFSTFRHTGAPVPLFAFGPNAVSFTGVLDNTHIPVLLARYLGLDGFAPTLPPAAPRR
jgi:alkaline phosphatase